MGTSVNKVLLPIAGRTVLARTLDRFELHPSVGRIVVVAAEHELELVSEIIDASGAAKVTGIVAGGPTRHASEWNGLLALAPAIESGTIGVVLMHDGARPFVSSGEIDRVIAAARSCGAAIPTLAVAGADIMGVSEIGDLEDPPPGLHAVQTPQGFDGHLILAAHTLAANDGFDGVDTASVAEHAGHRVRVVQGSLANFKLTTPEDLVRAELVLACAGVGAEILQV
jgi:2-C-methyl-D-erythritol 4-phosphate cytidylyltransferase